MESAEKTMDKSPKTIVVGLGNPILSDDGIGVLVAREVEERLSDVSDDIEVTEASVGGLRLVEMLDGYDRAIIVDAIQTSPDREAGSYARMTLDDLDRISPTQHSASPHDTTFVTALKCARRLGLRVPSDVTLYAIEVRNVMDFGLELTSGVAAAIPDVTTEVMTQIQGD